MDNNISISKTFLLAHKIITHTNTLLNRKGICVEIDITKCGKTNFYNIFGKTKLIFGSSFNNTTELINISDEDLIFITLFILNYYSSFCTDIYPLYFDDVDDIFYNIDFIINFAYNHIEFKVTGKKEIIKNLYEKSQEYFKDKMDLFLESQKQREIHRLYLKLKNPPEDPYEYDQICNELQKILEDDIKPDE